VEVEVVRSARRRRTVQARVVDGVLRVSVPAAMPADEERRWVEEMVRRIARRTTTGAIDLEARARRLADRHDLPRPASVVWSERQRSRWGSCTPSTGAIRVSSRLAAWPPWVLDYVLVHELAHLVAADHGPRFQALVARYPLAERARGFLIAKGGSPDDDGAGSPEDDEAGSPQDDEREIEAEREPATGGGRDVGRAAAGR
jgi:hypothetical protein